LRGFGRDDLIGDEVRETAQRACTAGALDVRRAWIRDRIERELERETIGQSDGDVIDEASGTDVLQMYVRDVRVVKPEVERRGRDRRYGLHQLVERRVERRVADIAGRLVVAIDGCYEFRIRLELPERCGHAGRQRHAETR